MSENDELLHFDHLHFGESTSDSDHAPGTAALLRSTHQKSKVTKDRVDKKDSGYLSYPIDELDITELLNDNLTYLNDASHTEKLARSEHSKNSMNTRWSIEAKSPLSDPSGGSQTPSESVYYLRNNQTKPKDPSVIETLEAANLQIKSIPEWTVECKNLKNINLKGNIIHFDDNFLKTFAYNDGPLILRLNLEEQFKKSNSLKGNSEGLKAGIIRSVPDGISILHSLKELQLRHNGIETISPQIQYLQHLCVLDLSMNKFRVLPDVICKLYGLEYLTLQDNCLIELPSNIGELVNLKVLGLSRNNLKMLPDTLCHLVKLEMLSLENNDLYYIPLCLFKLERLAMDDNMHVEQENWLYARRAMKGLFIQGNDNLVFPLKCSDMKTKDIFAALVRKTEYTEVALNEIKEIQRNIKKQGEDKTPVCANTAQVAGFKQLTDVNLLELISHIDAHKTWDLGIHLNLTFARITQLQTSSSNDTKGVLLHILNEWRGQWPIEEENDAIKSLQGALIKIGYRSLSDNFHVDSALK